MTSCCQNKKIGKRDDDQQNEVFNKILQKKQEEELKLKRAADAAAAAAAAAVVVEKSAVEKFTEYENNPCYLPQTGDDIPYLEQPMGPIGPWATGKVDWSPFGGMTGVRPVVNSYSITRFSPNEWRGRNFEIIKDNFVVYDLEKRNKAQSKLTVTSTINNVEETQKQTNAKVQQRLNLVGQWKKILEMGIKTMQDEISTMEEDRNRLKTSLVVLGIPESIAKECIEKRSTRSDYELIRDPPEEQLVNEVALIAEIRRRLHDTLKKFEQQQIANRAARDRLELDWSDKKQAFEIDAENIQLNNNSTTIMFHPGAVRLPPGQASEQYWDYFSRGTLKECEETRERSIKLRHTLNSILMSAAKDIRKQADIVEKAFIVRINCVQENLTQFENDLKQIVRTLAETETRIEFLRNTVNSFDNGMKVAQTRMYNRGYRPNVENCRDSAQQQLIDEVKLIQNGVENIIHELNDTEKVKKDLMGRRKFLEREIINRRRTLMIDRDRCFLLRSHYPTAETLSGMGGAK